MRADRITREALWALISLPSAMVLFATVFYYKALIDARPYRWWIKSDAARWTVHAAPFRAPIFAPLAGVFAVAVILCLLGVARNWWADHLTRAVGLAALALPAAIFLFFLGMAVHDSAETCPVTWCGDDAAPYSATAVEAKVAVGTLIVAFVGIAMVFLGAMDEFRRRPPSRLPRTG